MSRSYCDGVRRLRAFTGLTSLSKLPTLTGDENEMLLQWIGFLMQDCRGILKPATAKVRGLCPTVVKFV